MPLSRFSNTNIKKLYKKWSKSKPIFTCAVQSERPSESWSTSRREVHSLPIYVDVLPILHSSTFGQVYDEEEQTNHVEKILLLWFAGGETNPMLLLVVILFVVGLVVISLIK